MESSDKEQIYKDMYVIAQSLIATNDIIIFLCGYLYRVSPDLAVLIADDIKKFCEPNNLPIQISIPFQSLAQRIEDILRGGEHTYLYSVQKNPSSQDPEELRKQIHLIFDRTKPKTS
jgi:hypothetical protein